MTKSSDELWREIEETRLVKPAFERMAASGGSACTLAVPQWMDEGHIGKLAAILRWGTRDQVVKVFENSGEVEAGFDGVAILRNEAMEEEDRAKAAGALDRLTYVTADAVRDNSFAVKRALYRPQRGGKRRRRDDGDGGPKQRILSPDNGNRKLWHKLFTISDNLPVCDPVYAVEAMDRLIGHPKLEAEEVGAALLVEHVRKAVESALRKPVMKIIRKAIEEKDRTFEIDESEISDAAAKALSRADLGRFHEGLQGLPGMQLVSVDSPLVKSIILDKDPRRAARNEKKVLGILEGA